MARQTTCACCGEEEFDYLLCLRCQTEADEIRNNITNLMANYHNRFGIEFQRNEKYYLELITPIDDHYLSYGSSKSRDGEDFHSDG